MLQPASHSLTVPRTIVVVLVYCICAMLGSLVVAGAMPEGLVSEPGLLTQPQAFALLGLVNSLLICALVLSSSGTGLRWALLLGFLYYTVVTVLMQVETWYFLSRTTVSAHLLPRLFLMGLPVAFVAIPVIERLLRVPEAPPAMPSFAGMFGSTSQLARNFLLAMLAYLALYLLAGYFLAWRNPVLREFYGWEGEALGFWAHLDYLWNNDPGLFHR